MNLQETDNSPDAATHQTAPFSKRFKLIAALILAVPIVITVIGVLTAPPRAARLPLGHLLYLEADQPSEHTTMLRGLYLIGENGASRPLAHEMEPQDTDAGAREWINQPVMSPDGRSIAFIKQLITLQEEKQEVINQLCVLPTHPDNAPTRMLLDLSKLKLKQIVGLAWTPDSQSIVFLQDGSQYHVSNTDKPQVSITPLLNAPALRFAPELSATRQPAISKNGTLTYAADTTSGTSIIAESGGALSGNQKILTWALGPNRELAYVDSHSPGQISVINTATKGVIQTLNAHWGWSIFGGRKITSLHWSPDGRYIAYTVSKPPVPDNELFYADLQTGKSYLLPIRTGRASWDWAP